MAMATGIVDTIPLMGFAHRLMRQLEGDFSALTHDEVEVVIREVEVVDGIRHQEAAAILAQTRTSNQGIT
jgi:hypothetical protein